MLDTPNTHNSASDATLTTDESLRQWWHERFNDALPDDVATYLRALVRQETSRSRRTEHILDDISLAKVRQGRRLCQTKLDNIEQALDELHAQRQRIRRFITINKELEKQQERLYDAGKRHASVLSQQHELERYENFEAVSGRFQRIAVLTDSTEALRQQQNSISIDMDNARRVTDEAEKAMVIERQKFGETREALYRAASNMAEAERLQMHINDATERQHATEERLRRLGQELQHLRMTQQETQNTLEQHRQRAQQLASHQQTLEAHRRLINKGEGVLVMLDELATALSAQKALQTELQQAMALRSERNEQLSRLFSQSQDIQADIDAKNEEIKGHRRSIAGQESYSLGRRAMELRSRRQMLQTGLSLWRSIAAGYDHIEMKQQLITQLRLQADNLNRNVDALQTEVRNITRQLEEKTYHWTLSKSQNVIELRADLQEGFPCTVCGATHHPWHSDSIAEQNALIATMKADCDTLRAELATKGARLHDLQMELTATQGKLAVENDNIELLLSRQQKDTNEWHTFSRLDNSLTDCSPSTNREARTSMIRQLIEKTTIDAEDAEKALDTFNYHLNAINGISSELEKVQRQSADLALRLNEVNTACQVMASQVERLNQRIANITQDVTRRRNDLDKLITIPDWFNSWQQSPESMRLRIDTMMEEWATLQRQTQESKADIAILEAREATLNQDIETLVTEISDAEGDDAQVTDLIKKSNNALDHILQGYESETIFAVARTHLERQQAALNDHIDRWVGRLRDSMTMEARNSNIQQTIQQTEQRIVAERQELDVWMRRYNATHPPVQFPELERVLGDGREWGTTRQEIRDVIIEEAIAQTRVDNLRAEIIALQAEGLRPLIADGMEEQDHLRAEQETLEEQRRSILIQIATYEQQLHKHELAISTNNGQ